MYDNNKEVNGELNRRESFIEKAKRERFFFNQFREHYNLFNSKNYEVKLNPAEGTDRYDVLIHKYNDGEYIPSNRIIMEIKVRNLDKSKLIRCEKDGFVLEAKKLKELIKVCNLDPDKNEIYYVNFTNHYTLIWNISLLIREKRMPKPIMMNMNVATVVSTADKENKKTFLLKKEDAMIYEYSAIEASYLANVSKEDELKRRRKLDIEYIGDTFTKLLDKLDEEKNGRKD